jgi:nickel/cobalt exporter
MTELPGNDRKSRIGNAAIATAIVGVALIACAHPAWAQFGPRPPAIGGIAGWLLAKQALFYTALAGMLRAAKSDGSALWGLMGVSFVYGIFHAAGPGHGKAVISSYLLANEETWRRGVTLSFASAVMQSLTAVAIVAIAAVMLGATAKIMGDTVRVIEIVSYGLIVLLGARLLWVKGGSFVAALRALRDESASATAGAESHHHGAACPHCYGPAPAHATIHDFACETAEAHDEHGHNHLHEYDEAGVLPWGHAHGPEPQDLAGPDGWQRGWSAVVAVGLRPCSGAIIVLVFALAQGLLWAGIASTFVMGLGTAITVATIATLAVGTKALAKRVVGRPLGYGGVLVRGAEAGAAALILAFGILLLTGYMASERMGLF